MTSCILSPKILDKATHPFHSGVQFSLHTWWRNEVTGQHFPGCWLLNASVHLYQSFYFLPIKNYWILWISFPLIQGILPLCSPSPKLSSKVYSRFSVSPFPLCINLSILPNWILSLTIHWSFSHQEQQWILLYPWASWLYLRRFSSRFQSQSLALPWNTFMEPGYPLDFVGCLR